jgi:hypothetical protein
MNNHGGNETFNVFRDHKWQRLPWTRVRMNVRLKGGDLVHRYEIFPIEQKHIGVGGLLQADMGRSFVLDVSVSNPNWEQVGYVVDL